MNLLDAAYDYLKSAGVPMTAQEIVAPILKAGLWTTTGKTPDATLAARIYVDIKKNGEKSRFVKVGKGKFALSDNEDNEDNREDNAQAIDLILAKLKLNPRVSVRQLASELPISKSTVERGLHKLQSTGRILRNGGTRGVWEVLERKIKKD